MNREGRILKGSKVVKLLPNLTYLEKRKYKCILRRVEELSG